MVDTEKLRSSLPGQSLLVPCDRNLKMGSQGLCVSATLACDDSKTNTQEMSLDGTSKFEKLQGNTTLDKSLEGRPAKLEQSLAATSKLLPNVLDENSEVADAAETLQKTVKLQSNRSPPSTLKEALSVLKEAAGIQPSEAKAVPLLKEAAQDHIKTLKEKAATPDLENSMEASKVEDQSASLQSSMGLLDAEVAELRALLETAIHDSQSGHEEASDDERTVKLEATGSPTKTVGICGPSPALAEVTPTKLTRGVAPAALAEDLYDSSRSQSAWPCRSYSALSCASWMADSLEFSRSSVGYSARAHEEMSEGSCPEMSPSQGPDVSRSTSLSVDSSQLKAFTSAVRSAPGLGQDLQKELLDLLNGLPGCDSGARRTQ